MLALTPYAFVSPSRLLLMPDSERKTEYHPDPHGLGFCNLNTALGTLGEEWTRRVKLERCLPGDDAPGLVVEDERGLWVARLEG